MTALWMKAKPRARLDGEAGLGGRTGELDLDIEREKQLLVWAALFA
jgi:hypothetical protein